MVGPMDGGHNIRNTVVFGKACGISHAFGLEDTHLYGSDNSTCRRPAAVGDSCSRFTVLPSLPLEPSTHSHRKAGMEHTPPTRKLSISALHASQTS